MAAAKLQLELGDQKTAPLATRARRTTSRTVPTTAANSTIRSWSDKGAAAYNEAGAPRSQAGQQPAKHQGTP